MNLEQTYYIKQAKESLSRWQAELGGKHTPIYPELLNFYISCVRDAKVNGDYGNPEPYIAPLVEKTLELIVKHKPTIKDSLCWSLLGLLDSEELIKKLLDNKEAALNTACILLYIAQYVTPESNEHAQIRSILQVWNGALKPTTEATVVQEVAENLFEIPWLVLYASDLATGEHEHACYEVVLQTQPRLSNFADHIDNIPNSLPQDFN